MEFFYLRSIGVFKNMFVWDEWSDKTLTKLKEQGYKALYEKDFLPQRKLKTVKQMIACEGFVVRLLLSTLLNIIYIDNAKEQVDIQTFKKWQSQIKPSFEKIIYLISKYKITAINDFILKILTDDKFKKYRPYLLKAYLEDSYYAFGSNDYNEMYGNYINKKISQSDYDKWKVTVYNQNLSAYNDIGQ